MPLDALSMLERTLVFPLWARARYRGAGFADDVSAAVLARVGADEAQLARDFGLYGIVALGERARRMDAVALGFLARHPDACVVNLGGGLDPLAERLGAAGAAARFVTLDLPEVVALRRSCLPDTARSVSVAASMLDPGALDAVDDFVRGRTAPALFLLAGVQMYLPPAGFAGLVHALAARHPGAELCFDAYSRPAMHLTNAAIRLSRQPDAPVCGHLSTAAPLHAAVPGLEVLAVAPILPPAGVALDARTRLLVWVARVLRFSTLWHVRFPSTPVPSFALLAPHGAFND